MSFLCSTKPNAAAQGTVRALPQDLIFSFFGGGIFSLRVFEASRGLIESARGGGGEGEEGENAKQEKEGFGERERERERELKTTLQCSATSAVAAQRARSYSVPPILTIKSL